MRGSMILMIFSASLFDPPVDFINFNFKTFNDTVKTGACGGPSFLINLYSGRILYLC